MLILKTAWRNLWRNKRRTYLTLAAITLGLALLIVIVSFMQGFVDLMIEQATRSGIGHIQIHKKGYLLNKRVDNVIENVGPLVKAIEKLPGVQAVSPRLLFTGSVRSGQSTSVQVVKVMAVDPKIEKHFSVLAQKVVKGGFVVPPPESLKPNAPLRYKLRKGVLIGDKLAKLLKVDLGSKIRLDCASFGGATTSMALYITGIFHTGSDELDKFLVLVNRKDMLRQTHKSNIAHELAIAVTDMSQIPSIVNQIKRTLVSMHPQTALEVTPWWDVVPEIKVLIQVMQAWIGIWYIVLMVILSSGILTTMFMMIFERKREFGIQLAIGEKPLRLFAGIMCEAFYMASLSVILGIILSIPAVAYLKAYGIDLRWLVGGYSIAGLFVENVYYGSAAPQIFVEPALAVFAGTFILAIFPAIKVARMKPIEGLRFSK